MVSTLFWVAENMNLALFYLTKLTAFFNNSLATFSLSAFYKRKSHYYFVWSKCEQAIHSWNLRYRL